MIIALFIGFLFSVYPSFQSDFRRTLVFLRVDTDLGEDVFLRGGAKCAHGSCPVPIRHRKLSAPAQSSAAYIWSQGDDYLDWNGAETSQKAFKGQPPEGTPMIWSTDRHGGPVLSQDGFGYTPENQLGSNFWMLDVDMDCSQTHSGWFEFKAFTTSGNEGSWEPDIEQSEVCGGDAEGQRSYRSRNHMGKCGMMNVFYFANYGCIIATMNYTSVQPTNGECGRRPIATQRIVGGQPASPGHWPWMLEVMYKDNHGCGAVLLSPKWVVTAGHCVRTAKTYGPWATIIRAGETNRHTISGREKDYFVKTIIKHPLFDKSKPNHDIALLEMLVPIYTKTDVTAACLPIGFTLDEFVNEECWGIGWGSTNGGGDRMKLQEVKMDVSSNAQCHHYYGNNVTSRDVCAGLGSKSACGGDSGSPLSCNMNGRWYVVGVVSWGDDGCQGKPSVYTRISGYLDWIKAETGLDVSGSNIIG